MKIAMLRLRNRILNRFKQSKTIAKAKITTKRVSNGLGFVTLKKTLKVIPTSGQKKTKLPQKRSPVSMGAKLAASLIGSRRVVIRNRRLMGSPRAQYYVAATA